ncbi:hypothetical protein [Streptomyces sp. SID12488]|uniref:hypothetical protein n=1 Tax=Streptomyces sp. SID12488 TaxID=2706040 RepID=UPI0013DCE5FA|nr:hypothetical protein [Streptomyces sp. SID12488]NEA61199.1 hypothetical protein [Streptomyces sp. SID12488]
MTFNANSAAMHIEAREEATRRLWQHAETWKGRAMTPTARAIESRLLGEIAEHDGKVRRLVENGAEAERMNEFLTLTDAPVKRDLDSVRVGRMTVAELRSAEWVTDTSDGLIETVLNAGGYGSRLLPLISTQPFGKLRGRVAVPPLLTAHLLGRNDPDTAVENPVTAGLFEAVKLSAFATADRDEITDLPIIETATENGLAAAVGARADHFLLNGGTTTDGEFQGLLSGAVDTSVSAVDTAALFDAVARVQDAGADASAIVARPSEIAAILSSVPGDKLDRLPALLSIPDLNDGSVVMPVGKVLVADLRSIFAVIRKKPEFHASTEAPEVHERDQILMGMRARIGSPIVARVGRVQTLTKSA